MSTNKKDEAFAAYMTFAHVTELATADFDKLEQQVKEERCKYEDALKEAYALEGVLNTKRREKALTMIDETHNEFVEKAKSIITIYVQTYEKTKAEWQVIAPKYRWNMDNLEWNTKEFHRFCSEFAGKYGNWFWDIRLRHDPLDDMCYGYASIAELQSQTGQNEPWYPWMEDWMCIPYGARLLKYYMDGLPDWHGDPAWIDLTMNIIRDRKQFFNKPSKELRKMLSYDKK